MQGESTWRKSDDWKSRYSKLYSRRISMPTQEEPRRISFMNYDSTPYSELLLKLRSGSGSSSRNTKDQPDIQTPSYVKSILSRQSDMFASIIRDSNRSGSLGRHDTLLLDMVRAHRHEAQDEAPDEPLDLPRDDASEDMSESCVHGLNLRYTERSMSRSRVSRISTRRDMDIPSILAFTASTTAPPPNIPVIVMRDAWNALVPMRKYLPHPVGGVASRWQKREAVDTYMDDEKITVDASKHQRINNVQASISIINNIIISTRAMYFLAQLEIPAFHKPAPEKPEEIPKWSIRRSVCPVCSQKWKDRSAIEKIKNSGLKRNFLAELPSVIAPARLRSSIRMGLSRPALIAIDNDTGLSPGGLRNNSAAWQLTRARRFRSPKPQLPPPEATAPPASTAPLARKDLDTRVNKFLTT
ncbi:hypothetical protein MSG28_013209 [Choristoneura fumiferana]|uniref:Uncharacterized protein n=1 Tax=Choristoneura fumiferana TaxID=7141 RepID=A0ACC0KS14_CHOFU|nr:hypothetical protein MSG28_013209 [Choristoneura fumiferana]